MWKWSATDLATAIRHRQLSPVEVTESVLQRITELQPTLNCFITVCAERALQEARVAEAALMSGDAPLGALHGVPFSVKDIVNTEGVPTTFGALPMRANVPAQDAVSVARLRMAGGILVGKTTTPEFGSKGFTDSPLFGVTRNAWSAHHTSGGSSGGAAVAVAAGMAPLAVATDGGGSTRIPAACNGVVGIKQTIGVVPHSQAQDLFGNQTYVTPTTRNVRDTALMLDVMSGAHACDPWSQGRAATACLPALQNLPPDLKGRRFRYNLAPEGQRASAEVEQRFMQVLDLIRSLGASVEPFDAQLKIEPIWRTVNHTVWRARFSQLVAQHRDELSATFVRQIESAAHYSAIDYQNAMFARSRLFQTVQSWFEHCDFVLTPTLSRTALPLGTDIFDTMEIDGTELEDIRANWYPWTMPFNMTGHPAISIPCGFGEHRLPMGLQIVAPMFADTAMLQTAAQLEAALGLLDARPACDSL
ncbi:amidase [Diaphorobacter sp. NR2-3-3-1]|nr:amidase [Diaphorobacter caeni]